jgi:hypothetical protein
MWKKGVQMSPVEMLVTVLVIVVIIVIVVLLVWKLPEQAKQIVNSTSSFIKNLF